MNIEGWSEYVEHLEQFFEANRIIGEDNNTKRWSTFLLVVGPGPYKLLQNILAPVKPRKTFEQLVQVLLKYYDPPLSEVMQRFRFNSRTRKPGESVATYIAELRTLVEYCNFGDTLEKMLRDHLLTGINDDGIQKKLLQSQNLLTNERWKLLCKEAEKNLREMRAPQRVRDTLGSNGRKQDAGGVHVHKVTSARTLNNKVSDYTCYCCGRVGHRITDCKLHDQTCHKCGKKGHLAKVCRSSANPQQGRHMYKQLWSEKQRKPIRQVDNAEEESDDSLTSIDAVKQIGGKVPSLKVHVQIDECEVPMEIDTGASVSIMSEDVHQRLWPTKHLGVSNIKLQTYSKEPLPVVDVREVDVMYEGQRANLPLVVVKGNGPTLLGRNWLGSIRLDWCKIHYTPCTGLQNLLEKYKEVFHDTLGSSRGWQAKIEANSEATHVFARPAPYPML